MYIVTYREDPAGAEVISHRLMVRAGLIYQISSGVYFYSPLMWRTLRKIMQIVREELDKDGCLETQMPILQARELWEQSGRWDAYQTSRTMMTTSDRRGNIYGLSPTAEEMVTAYARHTIHSYKQLPVTLYQVHTKFRDEIRPRFGLLRVKEFIMMDAYSFDQDQAGLDKSFEKMRLCYHRIFRRMGLEAFGVEADPGDIGGTGSMEFMLAAATGEDTILIEESSGYAANSEKAVSRLSPPASLGEAERPMRIESTPGIRTCEQLASFFPSVPLSQMLKTVFFKAVHKDREVLWAALIRGDQQINEVKLRNQTGGLALVMLTDEEIRLHTGADQGFAGPVALPNTIKLISDESVRGMRNILCGVNQTDRHALDVNPGRDFPEPLYADIRLAREGEPGPVNGEPLVQRRGIEAGHIFKLGSKYSAAMDATFLNEQGKSRPFAMGCYGIGISRLAASAVEQFSDDRGIVWPVAIAPYEVVVAALDKGVDTQRVAQETHQLLLGAGIDAMLDERHLSAGARFNDFELLGFPYAVLVGKAWKQEEKIEIRTRATGTVEVLTPSDAVKVLSERIANARLGK